MTDGRGQARRIEQLKIPVSEEEGSHLNDRHDATRTPGRRQHIVVAVRPLLDREARSSDGFVTRTCSQHGVRCSITALIVVMLMIAESGCGTKPAPLGALTLVISGDTAGWIVPCGCTSNQSGGLARRGSFVQSSRSHGAVLAADVGGAAAGTSPYDRTKFEAILAGELKMGLVAHNIGAAEAKFGPDYLRDVTRRLKVPLTSCNVTDNTGRLIADSHRIAEIAGRRIAFVGVLADSPAIPGVKIESPLAAVLNLLPSLKGKFDHLIVLAYLPEPELRALAMSLPEADAVVGGPTGQSIVPERAGPTWLAAATNKGKFVISLALGKNDRAWSGKVHELNVQFSDDAQQTENVAAFHRALADHDFTADQTSFVSMAAKDFPAGYRVVGSDRCVDCHASACDAWKSSKHATAWDSLTHTGSQVDAYCQQCHTSGFGLPGGFESVTRSPKRVSVGCEDCHGAGSAHVAEPAIHTPLFHQSQHRCQHCHDRENSPKFSYETYWPLISHGGKQP